MARRLTCESGRHLALDGKPLVCIGIVREAGSGAYAIAPSDADALAHYIAETLDWKDFTQNFIPVYRRRP